MEIWGNTYKSNLQPLCTLQKRAIRIINDTGYLEHTNPLFIKAHTLKFTDMVKYKTAQIMYKARHNLLLGEVQNIFRERQGGNKLRGEFNLDYIGIGDYKTKSEFVEFVCIWFILFCFEYGMIER